MQGCPWRWKWAYVCVWGGGGGAGFWGGGRGVNVLRGCPLALDVGNGRGHPSFHIAQGVGAVPF